MKAKEVAFLHSSARMSGVEISTINLLDRLDLSVWHPRVICPAKGELEEASSKENVLVEIIGWPKIIPTSLRFGLRDYRVPNPISWIWNLVVLLIAGFRVAQYLKRQQIDLLVTKGMFAHLVGGIAARLANVPCLWHLQDFISERYGGLYKKFWGGLAGLLPDWIVADGSAILLQLSKNTQHKSEVILNGVDLQKFHPEVDGKLFRKDHNIPPEALVIGHVARITPWKGQHHLLEIFGELAKIYSNIYLLFVGSALFDKDDYEQNLHKRTEELDISDRVIFAGYLRDLPGVLAAMDIFAYPSVEKDTSPLALLSAMGMGIPIVAFDIPGVREAVEDAGILVPVENQHEFSEAIIALLRDVDLRKDYQRKARRRSENNLSLDTHAFHMEHAFQKCLQHSSQNF